MKTKYFVLVLIMMMCVVFGCTDAENATRVLEAQGYTDIATTGYAWLGCDGKSDYYSTGFIATAPNGKRITGVVCEGAFGIKGATIRIK